MQRALRILGAAGLALAAVNICGAEIGPDSRARCDAAFKALATYDLGQPNGVLADVENLVRESYGQPEVRNDLAARCVALLQSAAPRGAREFVCRQLASIGMAQEVPALAALLADEKLSSLARYALEQIPDSAAGDALRAAISAAKGKTLVGLIDSLGTRREEQSVPVLAGLLENSDATVALAAAKALGRIGSPGARRVLGPALERCSAAIRPAVARNCLLVADRLRADGRLTDAAALCDQVRAADVPEPVRRAAINGLMQSRPDARVALLKELLQSKDKRGFSLALFALREFPDVELTPAAAGELAGLPVPRPILLLEALGDRDPACVAAVAQAARAGDDAVRIASVRTLGQLADASCVPLLLEMAAGDGPLAQAAVDSLANIPVQAADAALQVALDEPDAKMRRIAIDALDRRHCAAAAPALLKAAGDADPAIRAAAIKALGNTAGLGNLDGLADLILHTGTPDLGTLESSLVSACLQIADKDACAAKLMARYATADLERKAAILRVLSQIGGQKALEAVQKAVADVRAEVQEAAIRALADTGGIESADSLVAIVENTAIDKKQKIFALRGYIRLASLPDVAPAQRLAMCRKALDLAQRDDERRLVFGAVGGTASAEGLALAVAHLDNTAVKNEASAAAIAVSQKIVRQQPRNVAQAMTKIVETTDSPLLKRQAQALLRRAEGKDKK